MQKLAKEEVLRLVTEFYLSSHDFNGIPLTDILDHFGGSRKPVLKVLGELIQEGNVGVIFSDVDANPHIIRTGFQSEEEQIAKLSNRGLACVYPRPQHLHPVVDRSRYDREPYKLCLALGEAQLKHRSFNLSVLEFYRNDPRYHYTCTDVSGSISVHDKYYESPDMHVRDQVLLQTFGFSYDSDLNRAVAVFLRYLADLSPDHQQIWKAKELDGDYRLHPDYYQYTILGNWGEKVSIFTAFLKELWLINQMAFAMARPPLFRQDFGEYGEEKPQKLGFLIRPTLEEFNDFVHLLDKMLSENINKDFFQNEVPYESERQRQDGRVEVQNKGTLQILDDWIREYFQTDEWRPWDASIAAMRKVRKTRQKPAHAVNENAFDQRYFKDQRELVIEAYSAVRTLRMMLEYHPAVKASGINVPDWLRDSRIWTC
jgi:hypothetical protein